MIKFYCDICGAEKEKRDILGVSGTWMNGFVLTSEDQVVPKIEECRKHICKGCLSNLGWNEEILTKELEEETK